MTAEGISFSGALLVFLNPTHLLINEYSGFEKHYLGCFYF